MPEGTPVFTESTPAQATLAQLRSLVYEQLRDTSMSTFEPWYIDAMLNEAYLDLNARLRIKRASATGTTHASTGIITVPADFIEVLPDGLWVTASADVGAIQPEITNDGVFNSYAKRNTSPPVYLARVFGATIEIYPLILSGAYTLEYVARPTVMVADNDVPSDLDREMEPRIIAYAIAKAKWQEGEMQEGNQNMAIYEEGLPGRPRMTNNLRPASMTMFPAPGPFDA